MLRGYDDWLFRQAEEQYDHYQGYCDECGLDNDEHGEDCINWGTTEEKRETASKQSDEEAKADMQYEQYRERLWEERTANYGH